MTTTPTDQAARAAAKAAACAHYIDPVRPPRLCVAVDAAIDAYIAALPPANVEAEREACARIAQRDADDFATRWPNPNPDERIVIKVARDIEAAIRARSQKAQNP